MVFLNPEETYAIGREQFLGALNKDGLVYGDLLSLLALSIGGIPESISPNAFQMAGFVEDVKRILRTRLESFTPLVLLKAGYLNESLSEAGKGAEEQVSWFDSLPVGHTKTVHGSSREVFIPLDPSEEESYFDQEFRGFFHLEELNSRVVYYTLQQWPIQSQDFFVYDILSTRSIEDLTRRLKRLESDFAANSRKFLVIDPLLYHLFKPRIAEVKDILANSAPNWILTSSEEFMSLFLSDRKNDFIDEYKHSLERLKGYIEWEYRFLSVRDEMSTISQSKKDISYSLHTLKSEFINPDEIEDSARRATKGVEGLLLVEYRIICGKRPNSRFTFGELLSSLRQEIILLYGDDIYLDLEYLRDIRNSINHPTGLHIDHIVLNKVVYRSNLFLELFQQRLRHYFDREVDSNAKIGE